MTNRGCRSGAIALAAAWALLMAAPNLASAQSDPPAPAVESAFSGFAYGAATLRQVNTSLNPANGARVPSSVLEAAGIIEFRQGDFWARARVEATHRRVSNRLPQAAFTESDIDLTQASWKLPLASSWALTIGRLNLGFDDGQSFHPLDYFEDAVRGSDFEDRAGRYRGFPMLVLSRADADSSLRFVYADDRDTDRTYVYGDPNPNFNRGFRQWLVSWRGSFDQLTVTAVAQRSIPGQAGVGLAASYVASAAWSFHGAAAIGHSNPLPLHRNVFLGRGTGLDASDVYINTSPMQTWRADDGRRYSRWLLGATWTAEDGTTVVSELWRDGRGMGSGARDIWQDVVRFHDGLANPAGRSINLAYDLEALRVANGMNWFLRYTTPLDGLGTLQLSNLLAADRSGTAAARWIHRPGADWDVSAELWRRYGGRLSLNGAVPDRTGVIFAVRRFF